MGGGHGHGGHHGGHGSGGGLGGAAGGILGSAAALGIGGALAVCRATFLYILCRIVFVFKIFFCISIVI